MKIASNGSHSSYAPPADTAQTSKARGTLVACVFPLYRWLSLGDGSGIAGSEQEIRLHSVSDSARGAQRDPHSDTKLLMERKSSAAWVDFWQALSAVTRREIPNRCSPTSSRTSGGPGIDDCAQEGLLPPSSSLVRQRTPLTRSSWYS